MVLSKAPPQNMSFNDIADDGFILTLNGMGHMMSLPDSYNQAFIDYAKCVRAPILDIGAAYGVSTIPALENGARVYANDIDEEHLKSIEERAPKKYKHNLKLIMGRFPQEVIFASNSFGAVLASRVLHFMTSTEFMLALEKIYDILTPGGKFFFVGLTPYIKNLESFIPIFEKRKQQGESWPGYIEDTAVYFSHRNGQIPDFLNVFDKDLIESALIKAGFCIEKCTYIRAKKAPKDVIYDGREHVGAIAYKPNRTS